MAIATIAQMGIRGRVVGPEGHAAGMPRALAVCTER